MGCLRDRAVVLSVRPEFAEKIASGQKRVELRRTNLTIVPRIAVIYSTMPVGRIVAVAGVDGVFRDSPQNIWSRFEGLSAIDKKNFDDYFEGMAKGTAIVFSQQLFRVSLPYSCLGLGVRPPQSFMYLDMAVVPVKLPGF